MAKDCRVYLSSTYLDLEDHRTAVHALLSKLELVEVVAMENYVATDQRPVDKCLADVDRCDIYVGLFAWRYGFVPPADQNPEGLSITELEFRRARQQGKHCLIFVLDEAADWKRKFMDEVTGENAKGDRINRLRSELLESHIASKFDNPQQLAGLVNAAVTRFLVAGRDEEATRAAEPAPQVRELRNSLYVAFCPADEALAGEIATRLAAASDMPPRLSADAAFANDEAGFEALERGVTRCHAAAMLLTPGSLGQLAPRAADVANVLAVMHARTGAAALLAVGVPASALPPEWSRYQVLEIALEPGATTQVHEASLVVAKRWLDARLPRFGTRTVGVPMSVVVMTASELAALERTPDLIATRLGVAVQQQFERLSQALGGEGVAWRERFRASRGEWRPFDPDGAPIVEFVETLVDNLNRRAPPKLRHREVKIQWYPFDGILGGDTRLRRIYREVAKAGCVVLVDEVSMFHPDLREALQNSPFFNNDEAAIVTVSPFDPGRGALNQLLEAETRRKLAGAFDRYAVECDPQCELAVSDEYRLRRWLHSSLPETMMRLQELQPDPEAIRAFFGARLGVAPTGPKGDYPWAGGRRS